MTTIRPPGPHLDVNRRVVPKVARFGSRTELVKGNQNKENVDEVLLFYTPKLIREFHREELAGRILTPDERRNCVSKQMNLSQLLGQIESAFHLSRHHRQCTYWFGTFSPTDPLPKITIE